ncbi:Tol-Pal system beta propeller repeat protein TolB [Curvivirga sp.]|uniref:Tol-Pal system beta propeller repeat protein TolB n=1 Tax=Curvivirga sp. TaxID=2856848 RepID=UPI003B5BAF92
MSMKSMFVKTRHLIVMISGLLMVSNMARAEVNIDITQGNVDPLPIAITNFIGELAPEHQIGRDMSEVISNDLNRSGIFRTIDSKAFIQKIDSAGVRPRYSDWRVINAQVLMTGGIELEPDGMMKVKYYLWDVFAEERLAGLAFNTEQSNWRRVAHLIADKIYEKLTGENGYFDSRIVYVAESGKKTSRKKRLAIMDQDGANHMFLTDGVDLVLTPRFSPKRHEITYLSYFNDRPRVYLFNIQTGRQEMLGDFAGMTFAPRFSPDGDSIVMSYAANGNTDIYLMDLRTRQSKRLTRGKGIETSPSFSPDGKYITYNADRGGSPQIYVMKADGSDAHRISFGKGSYSTPVWSPRGDLIAFTKFTQGKFHIGVMRTDGSGERLLSQSFLDEGPTWSPNGRVLMFFRQDRGDKGKTRLYSIDLTGNNLREVITPGDASDPAWSPLNP